MRDLQRSILRNTGRVTAGVAVGAVSGFALLSMRFVAANQFPSQGVAMIVVLVTAVIGGVAVGVRLWRQRPAPDEATVAQVVEESVEVPAQSWHRRPLEKFRDRSVRRSTGMAAANSGASVPDAA